MAILIAGGAGYIGSHVCLELVQSGYDIVVVDNFSNSTPESLLRVQRIVGKKFPVHQANLLLKEQLEVLFANYKIEAVIHLAALKAVGESVEIPLKYYHNNITGTLILCEVMKQFGVNRMVFSSSATVYGLPDSVPIHEDAPTRAMNPYGQTKLMIEQILRDLVVSDRSWSVSLLRYFNPIGAHHSGLIGESPRGIPNNLMPYITQVAIGNIPELKVYGNDYNTPDGTGVRDYIHVTDLAIGHVKALGHLMKRTGVDIFNLGTGRGYSVLELIAALEQASESRVPYTIVDRRPGDIAECYADVSKAARELKWVAKKGLAEMCEDTWRWQKKNPTGYK
jgi:UDP-glucose 4-epimerase